MNEKVAFGGGCFWCTEAVFKMLRGVSKVLPGYAGGSTENPTYEQVSAGRSGHVEVAYLEYDPERVKFRDLLTVFFGSHDPTTINRQGNDVGEQYRSVIFYTTEDQRKDAEEVIEEINAMPAGRQDSNSLGAPVVTTLEPLGTFYEAEDYHKDYYERNKSAPYCQVVINPKLEKVQKQFADLLARE